MALLRGIYFWFVVIFVTLFSVAGSAFGQLLLFRGSLIRRQSWGHKAGIFWGRTTYRLMPFWSIEIEGRENLPVSMEPMVIISNHQSAADIWVAYFLDCQFRWLSKKEVFRLPLIGWAMRWAGYISIDRGNARSHRDAMERSAQVLRTGVSMFFFPEGTRTLDGKMREFKLGAFRLAHELKVPILPVVVHGTKDLVPKGSLFPGRAQVRIRILPAQKFRDFDEQESDIQGFASHIRELMGREYEALAPNAHSPHRVVSRVADRSPS